MNTRSANGAIRASRCDGAKRWRHGVVLGAGLLCLMVVLVAGTVARAQSAPDTSNGATLTLQPPTAPAAAPEVTAEQPEATVKPKLSFLQLLLKGGWFMVPIVACSLLGMALIIERLTVLRRSQIIPAEFMAGLDRVYGSVADTSAGLRYCQAHGSPMARIMAAGIRKLPHGEAEAERAIADTGANEVAKLRRNLRTLHGIAAVAPTLGLLGTVWGMIEAFQAASRVGLGHSESLTTGIYEALVCTLAGLGIAIPVLMCYYYFVGRVDHIVIELNDMVADFLARKAKLPAEPPLIATPKGVAEPIVAED